MKIIARFVRLLLCAVTATLLMTTAVGQTANETDAPLPASRQMLLVVTDNWDAIPGTMQRFERQGKTSAWKPAGPPFPIVVGKSGLAWDGTLQMPAGNAAPLKREADGKSPAGVFRIGTAFGQSAEKLSGLRLPYLFLADNIECVDDAASSHYNQLLTRQSVTDANWQSSEKMWSEPLYKWGAVVAYNTPETRTGAGSCIFLHTWRARDRGTAGCTAMAEDNLVSTLRWLDPNKNPVIVQLPRTAYERVKKEWALP
jgi:D-alanyl-D-alanine dipeptidase